METIITKDTMNVTTQGVRGGKLSTFQSGYCAIRVGKGYGTPNHSILVDVFEGSGTNYKRADHAKLNISFRNGQEWNGTFETLQEILFKNK